MRDFFKDNLKAVASRAYQGDENYTVHSQAFIFEDSAAASWVFQQLPEVSEDEIVLSAEGLGDEGFGKAVAFDFEPKQQKGYYFFWRADNSVLHLEVQDRSGQFTEVRARKLADKMQSHLD